MNCDRLLIRDTSVQWMWNGLLTRDTAFFTTQKYDDIHVFVIWEFLEGIYIWIMCKVKLVAIQMNQTYVSFLRMFVCVDASHHKTTCHNIKLTDMWYLDISSLALTYIYLSKQIIIFGIDQLKKSSNQAKFYGWYFKKKSLVAKTIGRFFPELSHQKVIFGPN